MQNESEGNCNARGGSGEKGCTQHMPDTWKHHSRLVVGYEAPITYTNEVYITAHIVQKWIDKGYTDYQIGLLYNGGQLKAKKGVNKFGIKYDSGAYARKLVKNIINIAEAND